MNYIEGVLLQLMGILSQVDEDFINSMFEVAGGFFALNHCRVLYEDKGTRGVSLLSAFFFTIWGLWNLHYYTALGQPLSFYGAWFLVLANTLYLSMMFHYRRAGFACRRMGFDEEETVLAPESVGYQLGDRL